MFASFKDFSEEKTTSLGFKKQIIKSPYSAFNSAVFSIVVVVYTVRSTALFKRTFNDDVIN